MAGICIQYKSINNIEYHVNWETIIYDITLLSILK